MEIRTYRLQQHGDERGHLVSLEEKIDVPFEIKRVYYMFDTRPGVVRGMHAHKSLEQLLVCVHGSVKILLDNGKEKQYVILDNPYDGRALGDPDETMLAVALETAGYKSSKATKSDRPAPVRLTPVPGVSGREGYYVVSDVPGRDLSRPCTKMR